MTAICHGCDAAIIGMEKYTEYFKDVKVILGLQPVSAKPFLEKIVELKKLEASTGNIVQYVDDEYYINNGFTLMIDHQ